MIERKLKCIAVSLDVYAQLKRLGQTGDSFTKVISSLITEHGSKVIKEEVLGQGPTRPAPTGRNGAINPRATGYDYIDHKEVATADRITR